jgi:plastocyanin
MAHRTIWIAVWMLCLSVIGIHAQTATVRAKVEIEGGAKSHAALPSTVIWLIPMAGSAISNSSTTISSGQLVRLTQKNKAFDPHVLVVPAGSAVEFPNRDPFFHNVFSLFEGKRFDLGLYEAGTSRIVHFDRPGISYIFCNIHPEMSAVVITLNTPFYAVQHGEGQIEIPNVPFGRYQFHTWSEGNRPESAPAPGREFTLAEVSPKVVVVRVPAINQSLAHKNKYGRDYDPPAPDSPVYHQQR